VSTTSPMTPGELRKLRAVYRSAFEIIATRV
jgi:hypothetical protein